MHVICHGNVIRYFCYIPHPYSYNLLSGKSKGFYFVILVLHCRPMLKVTRTKIKLKFTQKMYRLSGDTEDHKERVNLKRAHNTLRDISCIYLESKQSALL